jgi:hypothetical protein
MAVRQKQCRRFVRRIICIVGLWSLTLSMEAWTPGRKSLPGHVPAEVARLQALGDLAETNRLNLTLGLPLRQPAALQQLLHDLYDPASVRYRHFLKPEAFTDQFGPSEEDYQRLVAFAQAHHFQILRTHANRVLLDVSASPSEVKDAFYVHMKTYQHPTQDRTFYAPDAEPSVDLELPLLHIAGLNNYDLPQPLLRAGKTSGSSPTSAGSGKGGTYLGHDFRAAYAPGVTLTGVGQSVALVEFDTYFTNDILDYERLAGISPVPITNVLVAGFSQERPGGGSEEVSADIEMAVAMAPGLSQVLVYEAPYGPTPVFDDILNQIAIDDLANQISCSWFFGINAATDQIFQQMAAQGQSFFNACGDFGAYFAQMGAKESDPYITEVGGTILTTSGPVGTWTGETAWHGGSGGIGSPRPIPYWQQAVPMSSNQGSTVWRNVPDVALTAENVLLIYDDGVTNGQTGTSLAAPLWASFTALVNEQAAQNGQPPVGFLNPAIYALGQSSLYASCFHDIVSGNNTNDLSPAKFFAVKGYDLCTGWGTPNGQALINALAPPDSLAILPANGLFLGLTNNSVAAEESQTLVLTNPGSTAINWSVAVSPPWLQISSTNGVVPPEAAVDLSVTPAPGMTNLSVGGYTADLVISNLTAGVAHDVPVFLQVSDPLIVTPTTPISISGPAGGPFNFASQNFSLSNASVAPLAWMVNSSSAFLQVAASGGTLNPGETASFTATLATNVSNLLINATSGSIAFADLTTGSTQTLPFTLAVGNGGFETGDFSDWSFGGHTNANFVKSSPVYFNYVHSGAYAAIMGEPTNLATLSQTLPTSPGANYLISFWLDNPVGGNPNEFKAAWNGLTLFDETNMPKFVWRNMEFVAGATASNTTLECFFQNEPDAFGFDDVIVTAIVPPAFASVALTNGAVQFDWSAMPGFSYQLQYSTNLAAPVWIDSGNPITATNGVVVAVDAMPSDPERFYRIVQALP